VTGLTVYAPNQLRDLAEACADDWPRLMFDGFGIMVSEEQEDAYRRLGKPGPREHDEFKFNWLSGGQRAGKTVFAFGCHADAALYKRGVDNTSRFYWRNYQYATLAIAPTDALTLRLWQIGDEVSKGAHDAQYDSKARRSRGGAFIDRLACGRDPKGNGLWTWRNGSRTEFRSSEGGAYRLEGGQWWFITWDEWASQPDREIHKIRVDVLMGRARDHDAKIMPMAWPKPETEHHLIEVIRAIEKGTDQESQVIYLAADKAFFTNKKAIAAEYRVKSKAEIRRTIKGEPAGGASKEYKQFVIDRMVNRELPLFEEPDFENFAYFQSWDLGLNNDATVGFTWRIPIIGGRRVVTPEFKARVVKRTQLPGSETRTPDEIYDAIRADKALYRAETAMDATGMGGLMAVRQLRDMRPRPHEFKSRSNDRVYGNMRLAAITNGLECASWGIPEREGGETDDEYVERIATLPWGIIEMPAYQDTIDQLGWFDRDDDKPADDEVWALQIGLWFIRRWWVLGDPGSMHHAVPFDLRRKRDPDAVPLTRRRRSVDMRPARLVSPVGPAVAPGGVRLIRPERGRGA
jgi:hypothetical protein